MGYEFLKKKEGKLCSSKNNTELFSKLKKNEIVIFQYEKEKMHKKKIEELSKK